MQDRDTLIYPTLRGLGPALDVRGGFEGPRELRSEAGLYLMHEISDYLGREQTYWITDSATTGVLGAAADVIVQLPSAAGLPFGRMLISYEVYSNNPTNFAGGRVSLGAAAGGSGYPATTRANTIATVSPTARVYGGAGAYYEMVCDPPLMHPPIWVPAGGYINFEFRVTAASGNYLLGALWATTEVELSGAAVGVQRAPVKTQ